MGEVWLNSLVDLSTIFVIRKMKTFGIYSVKGRRN